MGSILNTIKARRELIILALMLELLHLAIWVEFGSPLSRSFMLVHLGLFLIWQPVWRSDERLSWYNGLVFIFLTLAFVTWLNLVFLFAWLILLTGFASGRVLSYQQERPVYLVVLVFLVSQTIIKCTAMLFGLDISANISELFAYLLPILPLLILFMPVVPEKSTSSVDFLHATTASALVCLLIFGSLLYTFLSGTEYLTSLIYSLIIIGIFLSIISWLLSPRLGFSGLSQLWSRSLLNIGTPFEQWLSELSKLAQQQQTPEQFLQAAIEELANLPWVAGAKWKTESLSGEYGELTRYEAEMVSDNLTICIYTRNRVGGSLYLHCKLLTQLIENFYIGKLREKELTQQTHLQAIYETGARVTHDIKNLLQSLQAITSIVINDTDSSDNSVSQRILAKQMPSLTQRLQLALDKLQTPEKESHEGIYLKDWWQDLKTRNSSTDIEFQSDVSGDPIIPADLFDSVVDNLLENLREKSQLQTNLTIKISLFSEPDSIYLVVCDDGSALPGSIANTILKEPIKSDNGLGIGLYQAARHAESIGYCLNLSSNKEGQVCFELSSSNEAHSITDLFSGQRTRNHHPIE